MMNTLTRDLLLKRATEAKKRSYSPYSCFAVGAALLTEDGRIYEGANIENASFSATVCAERVAIFKAINDGNSKFIGIAITGSGDKPTCPCGICRQVMSEFCDHTFEIIAADSDCHEVVS